MVKLKLAKDLYINVMISNDIKLMNFLLAALTVLRGKVDFNRISVTIQWTEWQAPFIDLQVNCHFWKKENYHPHGSNPGSKNQMESKLTIRPYAPLLLPMNIWYMRSLSVKLYFELIFLIFYSFYNHLLSFKRWIYY